MEEDREYAIHMRSDMQLMLMERKEDPASSAISPFLEMGAYETLWTQPKASFKTLAERFKNNSNARPSSFVKREEGLDTAHRILKIVRESLSSQFRFDVCINGTLDYPRRLRDARYPVELLYFQGFWSLTESPCVSIVGTRNPSDEGRRRAEKLVSYLVSENYTIVSGLASGIDTIAHRTAIDAGGRTIAVIGTPISDVYPRGNASLQKEIAEKHLLISQIPFLRYRSQNFRLNRFFFPERNATMSALSKATIIIEAGETSGTLTQARAALYQGRKVLILNSCFENPNLTWPRRLQKQGAIRVHDLEDTMEALNDSTATD